VHYASHQLPDVRAWSCDFFACSAYKFYGPHVGVLWGRRELLAALDPPKLTPASGEPPELLEPGTLNHEGIVGAGAAVDFLASLAGGRAPRRERLALVSQALHERADLLLRQLWNGLEEIPQVALYGPPPGTPRTATLSFSVAGHASSAVAQYLAARGVFVSHGDFYATTAVRALGHEHDGLVRAGCAAYTTAEEIARLLEGVRQLVR
jgi:selenocysteine lyase/cysteine desulfurase